ncbi:unnamed protein product [Thelazia callipaeda]|uniref:Peroxin-19 n=1 Tax=Thelazia callipaeda TaxID=103827 RepID=A0A0N5CUH0_THECL|nr:unnamed protein product [Thelazia callipaeda]
MVEEDKDKTGNDLSALLDSALSDFGRTRNTDDEIDSLMNAMDEHAAQKAAQKFDVLMKMHQDEYTRLQPSGSSSETTRMTTEERKAAENFQTMLKALIDAEQKTLTEYPPKENGDNDYNRASAENFIERLKASLIINSILEEYFIYMHYIYYVETIMKLAEQDPENLTDESQYETLMSLVQTFFSKDLMYPPLKQLLERFPEYFANHTELDADTKARYEKQINVMERICSEYEKDESEDFDEMKQRFEVITSLMVELQSYGYPPEELLGEAPPGWARDPETGMPKVDNVSKAAEACSLM